MELKSENNEWIKSTPHTIAKEYLELNYLFGGGIIGSKLSPELGIRLIYSHADRYGRSNWHTGISYCLNMLTNSINNEFQNVELIQSANANFMYNVSGPSSNSSKWLGLQIGYVFLANGVLDKSIKIGFLTRIKTIELGFHTYFLKEPINPSKPSNKALFGVSCLF